MMRYGIFAALAALSSMPAIAGTTVLTDNNGTTATIYDNRDEWLAALGVGDLLEEDFEDASLVPGLHLGGTDYEFDGTLHQTLRNSANYLSMDFLVGANAIGFDYTLIPREGAEGLSLSLHFDNSEIYTSITSPSGFYGIIGSKTLTYLNFEARRYRTQEYRLDNLTIQPAGVPEPMTWAMLIFGFGTVGTAVRAKRAPIYA